TTVINAIPALSALSSGRTEEYTNYGKTNSYDAFADVTFKATERLELTAGLRYTYDDKTSGYGAWISSPSVIGGSTATVTRGLIVQPVATYYKDFTDSGVTWRLVARYELADDVNVYGSVSTGRRPKVLTGASLSEVPAEEVTSYEAGAKAALLDRRLTVDGAIYRYDYENFQTSGVTSTGTAITINAGEAKAYGFEGQANFQATSDLLVFATYGYSHARFGNGRYEGNHFRLSPDHSFSLGVKASRDTGIGKFTFLPTWTWQSEQFFDNNNDIAALQSTTGVIKDTVQDEVQKAFGLLNLRLTYQPKDSPVTFGAFVTNALDQDYIKDAGNTGDAFGIPTFIAGEPRFMGVSVSFKH
ncbi:TonB-dependent receptor, partial [Caulobacter sp. D4A]